MKLTNFFNIFKTQKKSIPMSNTFGRILSPIITKTDTLDFYTSWVWACVDKRAKAFAQVDFKLYKLSNGNVEEVIQHEVLDLLYKLNNQMTKFDFFELSSVYMDLFGASPWFLDYEGKSTPQAIYLIRPEYLKVNRNNDGDVVNYTYQIGSYSRTFEANEVIYLRNYNPKDPNRGLGIIEAVRSTAEQDDYMIQNNSQLLKNGSRPSGILEISDNIDDSTIKRLRQEWNDKYGGFENAGNVQILTDGMKFTPTAINPKDMDFIASQRFNMEKILNIFGVPKEILGNLSNANRASAQAVDYIFAKWTIEPIIHKYIEQLNEFLIPLFDDNLWLDFVSISQDDEDQKLAKVSQLVDKVITKNEARELYGYEAVEGGDVIYQSFGLAPMGTEMPTFGDEEKAIKFKATKKTNINTQKKDYIRKRILNRNLKLKKLCLKIENDISKKIDKTIKEKTAKIILKKDNSKKKVLKIKLKKGVKARITNNQRREFHQDRLKQEDVLRKVWQRQIKKYFKDQKERWIDDLVNKYKGIRPNGTKEFIENEEISAFVTIVEPLYYKSIMKGIDGAKKYFATPHFEVDDRWISTWLARVSREVGKQINETTKNEFENAIIESINAGESIDNLSNEISEIFDFMTDTRSTMIARTETARSLTEAHRRSFEDMGFYKVKWLLVDDDVTGDLDREYSLMEWNVDTIQGMQPVHPNCRCDFAPL